MSDKAKLEVYECTFCPSQIVAVALEGEELKGKCPGCGGAIEHVLTTGGGWVLIYQRDQLSRESGGSGE